MKVFLTGASGYIGGSVAKGLLAAGHEVSGLVRSAEKAALVEQRGIRPILGDLDDYESLTAAAREADAVVHAASADHPGAVITLIAALERTGKTLIHTTGSSIVADSAGGEYAGTVFHADDSYVEPVPYRRPRVTINRLIREAAITKGIRGIVICPGMVYGAGTGVQPNSVQIPALVSLSRHVGVGVYFGKGVNRYSTVHIEDLVQLYLLTLEKAPGGSLYFAENGHVSFLEIAEMISHAIGSNGATTSLDIDDLVRDHGDEGRYGLSSNSLMNAVNARYLGWSPSGPSLAEYFATLTCSQ